MYKNGEAIFMCAQQNIFQTYINVPYFILIQWKMLILLTGVLNALAGSDREIDIKPGMTEGDI